MMRAHPGSNLRGGGEGDGWLMMRAHPGSNLRGGGEGGRGLADDTRPTGIKPERRGRGTGGGVKCSWGVGESHVEVAGGPVAGRRGSKFMCRERLARWGEMAQVPLALARWGSGGKGAKSPSGDPSPHLNPEAEGAPHKCEYIVPTCIPSPPEPRGLHHSPGRPEQRLSVPLRQLPQPRRCQQEQWRAAPLVRPRDHRACPGQQRAQGAVPEPGGVADKPVKPRLCLDSVVQTCTGCCGWSMAVMRHKLLPQAWHSPSKAGMCKPSLPSCAVALQLEVP